MYNPSRRALWDGALSGTTAEGADRSHGAQVLCSLRKLDYSRVSTQVGLRYCLTIRHALDWIIQQFALSLEGGDAQFPTLQSQRLQASLHRLDVSVILKVLP